MREVEDDLEVEQKNEEEVTEDVEKADVEKG